MNKKGFLKLHTKKKYTEEAHIKVNRLNYELYFLNNQFFNDLGSHLQFWEYAGCNQHIFFFVEDVGGHLHFVKFPLWQQFSPFVRLQKASKTQDDRQKHVLGTLYATPQLHYLFLKARHLCGETYSKNWLEMLVYLLEHWHGTSQHNYPRSSPKLYLHHFHINWESKQQVDQMSFEHCLVVKMPRHWSFEDAKQILDHLCSVLATPIVECVSAYWNKGDKNNHASRKKGVNRVEMNE